jgi:hypothetical protein
LIAGGEFSTAGGVSASKIAKWNDSTWSPLGSGMTSYGCVYALTVFNNDLIAGGYFTNAGGISAHNIAKWNGYVGIKKISENIPDNFSLSQNYPNPFNPSTTIVFDIPKSSYTKLIVYDLLGREVVTLVDELLKAGSYKVNFNADRLSSGVYYYKLEANDFSQTRRMVVLK